MIPDLLKSRPLFLGLLMLAGFESVQGMPGPQVEEAKKAAELSRRPLTDADIDRYCAVRADITKLGQPKNTAADIQKWASESRAIRARHGITDSEYNVLLGRIMAAETLLGFEGRMPVRADKKADVEIVRKHLAKIRTAEGKAR